MSSTHIPAHLAALLQTDIRNKADRLVLVDALTDEDMLDEAAAVRGSWRSLSSNYHNFSDDEPAIVGLLIVDRIVNGTDLGDGYAVVRTLDDRYAVVWGNLCSREWNVLPSIAGRDSETYGDSEEGYRLYQTETEAKFALIEVAESLMDVSRTAVAGYDLLERVSGSEKFHRTGHDVVSGSDGFHLLVRDGHHEGTILSWSERGDCWSVFQIDQNEHLAVDRIAFVTLHDGASHEDGIDAVQIACDLDRGVFVVEEEDLLMLREDYGNSLRVLYSDS